MWRGISVLAVLCAALLAGGSDVSAQTPQATPAAPQDAKTFVDAAEQRLLKLWVDTSRADWVRSTYITERHRGPRGEGERAVHLGRRRLRQGRDEVRVREDGRGHGAQAEAPPAVPDARDAARSGRSGRGHPHRRGDGGHVRQGQVLPAGREVPRPRGHHEDHGDLARREGAARRLDRLARDRPADAKDYARYVELANKGARELGFADTGAMWRSKYDMPPDAFAKELDRLWEQVRPLYVSLHAYVRWKLREKYGDAVPGERPDPRAPARQHVGAGLGQHLSARRADRTPTRATT